MAEALRDSTDGYRGGPSGGAFAGRVKVLAFDSFVGTPIGGAYVVAGSSIANGVVTKTNAAASRMVVGLCAISTPSC